MEARELKETFIEEYQGASEELNKKRFKNATILFSKSLFAVCDILIHSKLSKLPKNHTERFRLLEEYFPEVYSKVDVIFNEYRDAYSKPILKETCEKIQNEIREITKTKGIPDEIKKIVEE